MRLVLLATILMPLPAQAQDFYCRNEAAEIRCVSNSCEVERESFTPMELRRTGNRLSICAYSGCWEGPIAMRRSRGGVTFLSATVRSKAPAEPSSASLSVMFDHEGTAQVRWLGFSNAMTCG
jgi:hypothetical protein